MTDFLRNSLFFRWKERVKGIEPSSLAWKAIALPLSYTRGLSHYWRMSEYGIPKNGLALNFFYVSILGCANGECRIRTCEGAAIRFTVWPLWPLGKLPFTYSCWIVLRVIFRRLKNMACLLFSFRSLYFLSFKFRSTWPDSSTVRPAGNASARSADIRTTPFSIIKLRWTVFHPAASWASGGTWTRNLLITNQPLCQLSYASGPSGPRTEQVYVFTGDVQDEDERTMTVTKK